MSEIKFGKCTLCKLDGMLVPTMGKDNELWYDFICLHCLNEARIIKIGSVLCFVKE